MYNAAGNSLGTLGVSGWPCKVVHNVFRPELLNPDEKLGLRGSCVALRKEGDDTRRWDHFSDF